MEIPPVKRQTVGKLSMCLKTRKSPRSDVALPSGYITPAPTLIPNSFLLASTAGVLIESLPTPRPPATYGVSLYDVLNRYSRLPWTVAIDSSTAAESGARHRTG